MTIRQHLAALCCQLGTHCFAMAERLDPLPVLPLPYQPTRLEVCVADAVDVYGCLAHVVPMEQGRPYAILGHQQQTGRRS